MKKHTIWIILLAMVVFVAGCAPAQTTTETGTSTEPTATNEQTEGQAEGQADDQDKLVVVTTLFPQYDFVRQIGGDRVEPVLLLPPGVEAHSYEPTPQDIVTIQNADAFIYTGEGMEPWALKMIENTGSDTVKVVDLFQVVEGADANHEDLTSDYGQETLVGEEVNEFQEGEEVHGDQDHSGPDPHIWKDPVKAMAMAYHITEVLVELDLENAAYYEENGKAYLEELDNLHHEAEEALEHLKSRTVYSGGHFAFGHFLARYNLAFESPYEGFAPDAEPTPKRIAQLIEAMKAKKVTTIFYEELVDPKVTKIIAEETGAQMLQLHGAHNVSKAELEAGVTYVEIMKQNIKNLKEGLGSEN